MSIKSKEKSLLFVTTRLPFPATSGRKNSLYHYCKIIKEIGYKVIVASFDDGSDLKYKPDFIDELIILPNPSKVKKILNILKNSFILRKFPMQVSLYYDSKISDIVKETVDMYNPSIVICDMVRTTEYLKGLNNVTTVADLDDRLSLRYQRQLDCDINEVNPYGLFLYSLPKFFQKILMLNFLKKYVMKIEIKLLKKYELDIGKKSDHTIFVAKNETDSFNKELGEDKAITIPIGVDVDYFKNEESTEINKDDIIGFLGVLNVSHNENAVKRFSKEIMPLILKKKINAKFVIIGGGASNELKKLSNDSIIFTGRVDDVREYLKKCKVFVCPLSFGSGIKTKNLEAMSMGLPVVTTTIGAENINAVDKRDWFIIDDNNEFANKIIELINNENLRKTIGKNAEYYIRDNWTWDLVKKSLEELIK